MAEGKKLLEELLAQSAFRLRHVFISEPLQQVFKEQLNAVPHSVHSEKEIAKYSQLRTSPGIIAIVEIPTNQKAFVPGWTLVLDEISDPGNMGSLIRTAEWFGVKNIWCNANCVDIFNHKVVQSAMGSLFRLCPVFYSPEVLKEKLETSQLPIFKAEMHGQNAFEMTFPEEGFLMMGSESHGISSTFKDLGNSVTIPGKGRAESLNVVVAAGVLASRLNT